jgi:hypothetical protein
VCGAVEVRRLLVVGSGPAGADVDCAETGTCKLTLRSGGAFWEPPKVRNTEKVKRRASPSGLSLDARVQPNNYASQ